MSDLSKPSKFRRDYNVILQRCKRFWKFLWLPEVTPGSKFEKSMKDLEEIIAEEAKSYNGNRTNDGLRLEPYKKTTKYLNNAAEILLDETNAVNHSKSFMLLELLRAAIEAEIALDTYIFQKHACQEAKEKVWINRTTRRPITQVTFDDIRSLGINVDKTKNLKSQFEYAERKIEHLTKLYFPDREEN